eukprot:364541-Chlamydomonas_euryale.AAC.8
MGFHLVKPNPWSVPLCRKERRRTEWMLAPISSHVHIACHMHCARALGCTSAIPRSTDGPSFGVHAQTQAWAACIHARLACMYMGADVARLMHAVMSCSCFAAPRSAMRPQPTPTCFSGTIVSRHTMLRVAARSGFHIAVLRDRDRRTVDDAGGGGPGPARPPVPAGGALRYVPRRLTPLPAARRGDGVDGAVAVPRPAVSLRPRCSAGPRGTRVPQGVRGARLTAAAGAEARDRLTTTCVGRPPHTQPVLPTQAPATPACRSIGCPPRAFPRTRASRHSQSVNHAPRYQDRGHRGAARGRGGVSGTARTRDKLLLLRSIPHPRTLCPALPCPALLAQPPSSLNSLGCPPLVSRGNDIQSDVKVRGARAISTTGKTRSSVHGRDEGLDLSHPRP